MPVPTEGHLHKTYPKHEACSSTQPTSHQPKGPGTGRGCQEKGKGGNGDRTTQGLLDPQTRLHQAQRHSTGQILMHCITSVPTEGSWNRKMNQRIPRQLCRPTEVEPTGQQSLPAAEVPLGCRVAARSHLTKRFLTSPPHKEDRGRTGGGARPRAVLQAGPLRPGSQPQNLPGAASNTP